MESLELRGILSHHRAGRLVSVPVSANRERLSDRCQPTVEVNECWARFKLIEDIGQMEVLHV